MMNPKSKIENQKFSRREFLGALSYAALIASGLVPPSVLAGQPGEQSHLSRFVFAQLKYRGGDWNPHPLAVTALMEELMQRTSVEAPVARHELALSDPDLFSYP